MKSIVLAMALTAASDPRSLGIGLDVVPQVFATAAARAHVAADLTRPTCTATGCRWDDGDGVTIAARLREGSLSIDRIEARRASADAAAAARYESACLTIVALLQPDATVDERRATAAAIAAGTDATARDPSGVTFYGLRPAREAGVPALRCGAVVDPIMDPVELK